MKRLEEAESRISELEDDNADLRVTAQHNAKARKELKAAVEDVTNRDRRQNLRLISLKERIEGRNPTDCVWKIIFEALDIGYRWIHHNYNRYILLLQKYPEMINHPGLS